MLNRKLHHDVQAQLINVRGFCGEIERTANELILLRESESISPDETLGNVDKLIGDDLLPCIKFLALSTSKLDELIIELRISVSDAGKPQ